MLLVVVEQLAPLDRSTKLWIAEDIDRVYGADIAVAVVGHLHQHVLDGAPVFFHLGARSGAAFAVHPVAITENDAIERRQLEPRRRREQKNARPRSIELRDQLGPERHGISAAHARRHDDRHDRRRFGEQQVERHQQLGTWTLAQPLSLRGHQEQWITSLLSHIEELEAEIVETVRKAAEQRAGKRVAYEERQAPVEAAGRNIRVI